MDYDQIRQQIAAHIRESGRSVRSVAHAAGMKQPTLQRVLSGEIRQTSLENLRAIAVALGKHPDTYVVTSSPSVTKRVDSYPAVPVLSALSLPRWLAGENVSKQEELACPTTHGDRTFALRTTGDSMQSQSGISCPAGSIVFADPDRAAASGDIVVAQISSGEIVVKQLVEDAGRRFLRSLNSSYPLIGSPFQVLARVIAVHQAV